MTPSIACQSVTVQDLELHARLGIPATLLKDAQVRRITTPEALELGVAIGIENIFDREPGPLKRLVTEVGDPNFGVCVDAGHLNIYSEAALDEWFGELGPHIKEVHLHDNNGRADEHLPIGEGTVDFPLFFSLLREYTRDPVLTIEQHGQESVSRGLKAIERFL